MRKIDVVVEQDESWPGVLWIHTVGMAALNLPELMMTQLLQFQVEERSEVLAEIAATMVDRAGTPAEVTLETELPLKGMGRAFALLLDKSEDPEYGGQLGGRVWEIRPAVDLSED